jgi:mannose-6-phosphate isomerase-like protein (cupin superfamily)
MGQPAAAVGARLRSLWVLGHRVTPIRTDAHASLLEVATPAGVPGPPLHYHEDCTEFFYVVDGRFGVRIADRWTSLVPGGYIEIPRGSVHTFRNEGEQEARLITGFDPPGFEKFFHEFGYDAAEPGAYDRSLGDEAVRRVAEGSARFHMILVSGP